MNKIKKSFMLIKSGKGLKSKMIISIFLIGNLFKVKNYEKLLFSRMIVSSNDGIFYVRKHIPYDLWMASNVADLKLGEELKLNNGVFIDVGANIGKYTIKIGNSLKMNGRVISFEPENDNFEMLKKNAKLNNLKNTTLINKALSDKKGKLKLYLAKGNLGHHSLVEKVGEKYEEVEVDTLDNILKELKISKVDLIKIDVEGAENLVLKGALKTLENSHPKIVFEAWDKNHLDKIKEVLEPLNYKIKQINKVDYFAI